MKRSGDITFNGGPLTKAFKRQLGYVMQVSSHAYNSACGTYLLAVLDLQRIKASSETDHTCSTCCRGIGNVESGDREKAHRSFR